MDQPRHKRGRGGRRTGVFLLALMQLAVVGFVPAADATLQGASLGETLHVEGAHADGCGAPHDHLFCQLCRVMTLAGESAALPSLLPPVSPPVVGNQRVGNLEAYGSQGLSGARGPRAPPLA